MVDKSNRNPVLNERAKVPFANAINPGFQSAPPTAVRVLLAGKHLPSGKKLLPVKPPFRKS